MSQSTEFVYKFILDSSARSFRMTPKLEVGLTAIYIYPQNDAKPELMLGFTQPTNDAKLGGMTSKNIGLAFLPNKKFP